MIDFFEQTNDHVKQLNYNEQKIFQYIIKNIHECSVMQIRELAGCCFVSTTTIIRLAKKLGFAGFREFKESMLFTCQTIDKTEFSDALRKSNYSEEYLKNIIESVRVVSQEKIDKFKNAINASSHIYCIGFGLDRVVADYANRVFSSLGYDASMPTEDFEYKKMLASVRDNDVLLIVSLPGNDKKVLNLVEKTRLKCKPVLATITQSANNMLQSLSDIDFYVFIDNICYHDVDLSSRTSMMSMIDLLLNNIVVGK